MEPAYKILQIFAIIILIKIPSTMMGYPLLAALGYTKVANLSVVAASFVHFFGLSVLIITNSLNIYSLACMAGISETFICLYRLVFVKIGRASCRGRGEISVVAGSLKKKKNQDRDIYGTSTLTYNQHISRFL